MMRRSPMKPGTKPLQRTAFGRKPADTTGVLRVQAFDREKKARKSMRSKQRAVTTEEKALWSRLASLGCIACMKDGVYQPVVSIHHVDGRTKAGCHRLVLPLCAGHHQDGTGEDKALVAVHPYKARFEARYGTQAELMARCAHLLNLRPGYVPAAQNNTETENV